MNFSKNFSLPIANNLPNPFSLPSLFYDIRPTKLQLFHSSPYSRLFPRIKPTCSCKNILFKVVPF